MTPFFSIITPVYNAEKYIGKCIESVLSQTLPDFELLLVDDGSPDNSGRICDEYAAKDTRIKVFHKENGGVSSARNCGLDNATGNYVIFLDADDWLTDNALQVCYENIITYNLDLLQFSIQGVRDDGKFSESTTFTRNSTATLTPVRYLNAGQVQVCAGGSCIKRDIVEKNNIRFKTNIKLAEDQLFIISSILHSERVKFENITLYNYLDNPSSATHANKSVDVINSIKEIEKFVKDHPLSKGLLERQTINFICILLRNNDIDINRISNIIKDKTFKYSRDLRMGEKFFCILSKINFKFSCALTRILFAIYYHNK